MLVVDASCLFEVVADTPGAELVRARLETDEDQAAPELVDAEVIGVIRRQRLLGALDATAAGQAVDDLREWPGERYPHRHLLGRAWEMYETVRTWDAFYVALAEIWDATLITTDARLARAPGPRCSIEVIAQSR